MKLEGMIRINIVADGRKRIFKESKIKNGKGVSHGIFK
jgi:hypothetical protein